MKLYMFRTVSGVYSLYTQQWYMSYRHCTQLSSRTRMGRLFHPGPARKLSTKLYDIHHCWVYSAINSWHCPKHVEFHDKIICEISASSWFYYKEICYDARSHERKKKKEVFVAKFVSIFRTLESCFGTSLPMMRNATDLCPHLQCSLILSM
jgi:hypothetical protein